MAGPVNDERPLDGADRLPRRIEPPRDLWPGIATRIARAKTVTPAFGNGPARAAWMRPVWMAAAALALVVGSSLVTWGIVRGGPGDPVADSRGAATLEGFAGLEAEYQGATDELLRAVRRGEVRLSPWTLTVLERNLRIIDEALAESRDALARDPANETLRLMILGTWRQKLDLLRRTAAAQL